ncbi:hypothetical protein UFOVP255_34 [uncultured Caudovirales phage]|uniref:Uncharacterized protein n=1 Tax=uncultured Caudovirales phage TaxID=2100421 RepID=A0A6J5LHR1_9CAUD|nr:hypothetical protein UFOVP255_34 [uncultured Caudovirales phage]
MNNENPYVIGRVEIEIDEPDLLPTCSSCTCEEGDEWICQYCEIEEETIVRDLDK